MEARLVNCTLRAHVCVSTYLLTMCFRGVFKVLHRARLTLLMRVRLQRRTRIFVCVSVCVSVCVYTHHWAPHSTDRRSEGSCVSSFCVFVSVHVYVYSTLHTQCSLPCTHREREYVRVLIALSECVCHVRVSRTFSPASACLSLCPPMYMCMCGAGGLRRAVLTSSVSVGVAEED